MMRRTFLRSVFWGQDVAGMCGAFGGDLIDGVRRPGSSGNKISLWSPSDEVVLSTMVESTASDVNDAVQAATRTVLSASGDWGHSTPADRAVCLRRLAELISAPDNERRLATAEALSSGMPISDATFSVQSSASCFRDFASVAMLDHGSVLPPFGVRGENTAITRREPIGVVGVITPYNYPLEMGAWKLAPALAAGNAVVWKPPEVSPFTAGILADLIKKAGFPDGVVNIVNGRSDVGNTIASHMDVDMVAFTGSIPGGRAVQIAAAKSNLKRCQLELGGNAALIVADDFDLNEAADVAMACFGNCGQSCTSVRRIFVPRSKQTDFLEKVVSRIGDRVVGHSLDPKVQQGPLISAQHLDQTLSRVKDATKTDRADLVVGGFRGEFPHGYFMVPTVLANCTASMRIVQEETFGPVMCVLPYDTTEHALADANSTINGLSANILSNNVDIIARTTRRLRAGMVWVNGADLMNATTPFGAIKSSGYGKDLGVSSLDVYSNVKTIVTHHRGPV